MANSLMFQRLPTHDGYEDPQLSNFYGLALPFLKRGVPVKTAHIENLAYGALDNTKVLLMSYSNLKPLDPVAHEHLAEWVKQGGVLVYSCRDNDPFQSVMEWWNQNGNSYAAPADHLFSLMGINAGAAAGEYKYGKGVVCIIRQDPKEYVLKPNGEKEFVEIVKSLYEGAAKAGKLQFKNALLLERGMYDLVAVLNESVSNEPHTIKGTLIDLFDPELPVYDKKQIKPGEQGYFVNVDRVKNSRPQVLASASRESDEVITSRSYSYIAKGPIRTSSVSRVLLKRCPKSVKLNGKEVFTAEEWDKTSRTYRVKFENDPDGVKVEFVW